MFHRLDLRVATDAGNRNTDVDRRSHPGVEEIALKKDLAVGDGDNVGRYVGGNVPRLGLNDRQSSKGAAAARVTHLGGAL